MPGGGGLYDRPVLSLRGIVKRYGKVTAVDGLSLELRHGEVFGLIVLDAGGIPLRGMGRAGLLATRRVRWRA